MTLTIWCLEMFIYTNINSSFGILQNLVILSSPNYAIHYSLKNSSSVQIKLWKNFYLFHVLSNFLSLVTNIWRQFFCAIHLGNTDSNLKFKKRITNCTLAILSVWNKISTNFEKKNFWKGFMDFLKLCVVDIYSKLNWNILAQPLCRLRKTI